MQASQLVKQTDPSANGNAFPEGTRSEFVCLSVCLSGADRWEARARILSGHLYRRWLDPIQNFFHVIQLRCWAGSLPLGAEQFCQMADGRALVGLRAVVLLQADQEALGVIWSCVAQPQERAWAGWRAMLQRRRRRNCAAQRGLLCLLERPFRGWLERAQQRSHFRQALEEGSARASERRATGAVNPKP
jgi:hypothetical protein